MAEKCKRKSLQNKNDNVIIKRKKHNEENSLDNMW